MDSSENRHVPSPSERRVLIVDDDPMLRRLLSFVLGKDCTLAEAGGGEEALAMLPGLAPCVVLLDILMPGIDGYETCRRMKAAHRDVQVIMVSAMSSTEQQLRAFEVGADDYMIKPFDAQDVRSRVRLHFQLREAMAGVDTIRAEIESRNAQIRQLADERVQDVIAIQDTAVFTLAKVAESRDQETGGHLVRMRAYSQILGEELAREGPYSDQISRQFLEDLYRSSPLHDIGKVGIRDDVLLKPGPLEPDEFEVMQQHVRIGAEILDQAIARSRGAGFLAMAAAIIRYHHERYDGAGYLEGLVADEIPLAARIVAVADVYDAITSVRPYKEAFPPERARRIVERGSGGHFDPVIVDAFGRRFADFIQVQEDAAADFTIAYDTLRPRASDPVPVLS